MRYLVQLLFYSCFLLTSTFLAAQQNTVGLLSKNQSTSTIRITDILGQNVFVQENFLSGQSLNLRDLPAGFYFLWIANSSGAIGLQKY